MRDYFSEEDKTNQDAIAAHQLSVLSQYQSPRENRCLVPLNSFA
jgi:hypothetical protein